MASRLDIIFNEDFDVGYALKFSTTTASTREWDWVVSRTNPFEVTAVTPLGTVGEATAARFKLALDTDIALDADLNDVYTITQSLNVVTIVSNTAGEKFNGGKALNNLLVDADVEFVVDNEYTQATTILTRSPYFINITEAGLQEVSVKLWVYSGLQGDSRDYENPNFTLSSKAVDESVSIDIAPLIDDFLEQEYKGDRYSTENYWVDYEVEKTIGGVVETPIITENVAFEGYGYFEEGENPTINKGLLQSNDTILHYSGERLTIPVKRGLVSNVGLYSNGGLIVDIPVSVPSDAITIQSNENIFYANNETVVPNSFYTVDEIRITETDNQVYQYAVRNIDECKYEPIKLTFINKFGALQDLWMFKTSKLSMNTNRKSYRSNIRGNVDYKVSNHQYRDFHVMGKESLKVNSGFYPEEYNDVFAELLLSRKVWVLYNGKTLPVTVKTSDISYKTRLNDSLISYSMDLDFAYDKINSVR